MADELSKRARKLLKSPEWVAAQVGSEAEVKLLAAALESEAALARKQEREECVKAMCNVCRIGKFEAVEYGLEYGPVKRQSEGSWVHYLEPDGRSWIHCRAAAIHARNQEDKG